MQRLVRLAVSAWLLLPAAAWACPVCTGGTAANQAAFRGTTVLLSLLPLALIGGVIFAVWRRVRALESEAPDAPATLTPEPSPR